MARRHNPFCEQKCPYLTSAESHVSRVTAGDAIDMYTGAGVGLSYLWRSHRTKECEGPTELPPQPTLSESVYCSYLGKALLANGRAAHKEVDLSKEAADHPYVRNPERWRELYWHCWRIDRQGVIGRLTMLDNDQYPEEELAQATLMSVEQIYLAYDRNADGELQSPETKLRAQEFETVMYIRKALDEHETIADAMISGLTYDAAIDVVVDSHANDIKGYATVLMTRELGGQTL